MRRRARFSVSRRHGWFFVLCGLQVVTAILLSYPTASTLSASPLLLGTAGDSQLFEPGGAVLFEVLRTRLIPLRGASETTRHLACGLLLLHVPLVSVSYALLAHRSSISQRLLFKRVLFCIPRFFALTLGAWLAVLCLAVAWYATASFLAHHLYTTLGERRLDLFQVGYLTLFVLLATIAVTTADLAKASVSLNAFSLRAAVHQAVAAVTRHRIALPAGFALRHGLAMGLPAITLLCTTGPILTGDAELSLAVGAAAQLASLGTSTWLRLDFICTALRAVARYETGNSASTAADTDGARR